MSTHRATATSSAAGSASVAERPAVPTALAGTASRSAAGQAHQAETAPIPAVTAFSYGASVGSAHGKFPTQPAEMSKMLGADPVKTTMTKDGTVRMVWQPNANTRVRFESHPEGLKPGDPGWSPRHHGEHYHIEVKPAGRSWKHAQNLTPPGAKPGQGTGFLPGETFPGVTKT
jgi:hypothetical protein